MQTTFLLPIIVILQLSAFGPAASQNPPIAKPNCLPHCNGIPIPFPFGTNESCYHSRGFFVTCKQNTSNTTQRLLWQDDALLEIKNISQNGQILVTHFIAKNCINSTTITNTVASLSLAQNFTVNTTVNKFTVVGCDANGFVSGQRPGSNYSTGCTATCTTSLDNLNSSSCKGSGCCQTSIPPDASTVHIEVRRRNNRTTGNVSSCNYGFLAEETAFEFSPEKVTNLRNIDRLPVVVNWAIGSATCDEAKKSLSEYACKSGNSICYEPDTGNGYRCRCEDGYNGNPYLPGGCLDINECLLGKCQHRCVNTVGSFECSCRRWYHGDGLVDGQGCKLNELLVVKIVIGVASGIIFLLLSAWLLSVYINRRKLRRLMHKYFVQNGGVKLQQELKNRGHSPDMFQIFEKSELEKATNSFHSSTVLGQGSFGRVYKGKLQDNREVAIKKPRGFDERQIDQFITEAIVLSQINHKCVVKLLGCCFETEIPLLVYEFISNGDLASYIHEPDKAPLLNWDMRLKIASQTAQVLSYLHSATSHPIIHRDIKSDNILLDSSFTVKVADFGASRLVPEVETPHSTAVLGTPGYVDPEYRQTKQLTTKSDVYGFGVVLLELLAGKRPVYIVGGKEENFVELFVSVMQQQQKSERLFELVYAQIVTKGNEEQIIRVAEVAEGCLKSKGEDRPSMEEVEKDLEKLRNERKSTLVKTE